MKEKFLDCLLSFIKGNKQFQPIYFWITLYNILIAISVIIMLIRPNWLTVSFVLGMMGFVATLIKFYRKPKV